MTKIVLFLVLIVIGAYNRYVALPFLRKEARVPGPLYIERFIHFPKFYPIAQEFVSRVKVETILIIILLLCGATLRHQVPARHAAHLQHQGMSGHVQRTSVGCDVTNWMDHEARLSE